MMKTAILLVLILAVTLTGCTVMETPAQRCRRYGNVSELYLRMVGDDWDSIWLYDHNSRLSQWHPYVGF
jgi:hypothetical protein